METGTCKFCATCAEVEVDHEDDDCEACQDQRAEDQYWEDRVDWMREQELL